MQWNEIREWLAPRAAERDEAFRKEIDRLARRSLYVIAAVEFGMPLVSVLFGVLLDVELITQQLRLPHLLPFFVLGALALLAARVDKAGNYARLLAYLLGTATASVMIGQYFFGRTTAGAGDELVLIINITIVLLVATAAVPGWPLHMLGMGLVIMVARLALGSAVPGAGPAAELLRSSHTFHFLPTATVLCAALTGANYQLLLSAYRAHHEAIRAQSRLLLAETAASTGRFVAAFSHELNNASGALRSAMETLQTIALRKVNANGAELAKLEATEADLRRLAVASVASLHETVSKVQRFVNLDRAERVSVDLNALLNDVVSLAATQIPAGTSVKTDLRTLPRVNLRHSKSARCFRNYSTRHAAAWPREARSCWRRGARTPTWRFGCRRRPESSPATKLRPPSSRASRRATGGCGPVTGISILLGRSSRRTAAKSGSKATPKPEQPSQSCSLAEHFRYTRKCYWDMRGVAGFTGITIPR